MIFILKAIGLLLGFILMIPIVIAIFLIMDLKYRQWIRNRKKH